MDSLIAGFWGAFFGAAGLMLAGSLAAYVRTRQRVALMAGLSAVMSAVFVAAYLGWLPADSPGAHARLLTHVAIGAALTLSLMLMSLLGLLKQPRHARAAVAALVAMAAAVLAVSWLLEPWRSLALGSAAALTAGCAMLAVTVRSALRGDRPAWAAVLGIAAMLVALAGLSWIALEPGAPRWLHAVCALCGIAYLALMATVMWSRYSYLLELSQAMVHGPNYDPVTRMRTHRDTSALVSDIFRPRPGEQRNIGVVAVVIANLEALESLHGRAALNHALFVFAARLRRAAPEYVEMGRLGDDGFLLLVRQLEDVARLEQLAREVRDRLTKPIDVGTSSDPARLEGSRRNWSAQAGVSVLVTTTQARPSEAMSVARAMARTAWTYSSRIAWYDRTGGEISELPPPGVA